MVGARMPFREQSNVWLRGRRDFRSVGGSSLQQDKARASDHRDASRSGLAGSGITPPPERRVAPIHKSDGNPRRGFAIAGNRRQTTARAITCGKPRE